VTCGLNLPYVVGRAIRGCVMIVTSNARQLLRSLQKLGQYILMMDVFCIKFMKLRILLIVGCVLSDMDMTSSSKLEDCAKRILYQPVGATLS
jgi:hypothetical protein